MTIPKWQLSGVTSRGGDVRAVTLDCKKYLEEKEEEEEEEEEEADTRVPQADSDDDVHAGSLFESRHGGRGGTDYQGETVCTGADS